jgi:Iron-containing redox enzyme
MKLPVSRGDLSSAIRALLRPDGAGGTPPSPEVFAQQIAAVNDPISDDDLQLALACCYELHYLGFEDIDDSLEWDPRVLSYRRQLEHRFESALRAEVRAADNPADDIDVSLTKIIDADTGPALSTYLMKLADVDQFRAFVRRRSVYHLKEADPHTWAIPRVTGRTKAALVEIQADEYGGGRANAMHSALFAQTMRSLGLDDSYGAYWGDADGSTFAASNLMTMFGLHRRLRGAALGHLAVFEMTSTAPNRRYGNGLRRLGFDAEATQFYDVHVEADAVHEQIAAVDMCGSFVAAEPLQRAHVIFGAACGLALENRFAESLLGSWNYADARRL